MSQLVRECQIVAGVFVTTDTQQLRSGIDAFISRLPEPVAILETHVMRLMLLDVAVHGGGTAHHGYHAVFPGVCRFDAADLLNRHWRADPGDPRVTFRQWAEDFVPSLERSHSIPLGARAVQALEVHNLARLDVKKLASELGYSPMELRREFHLWTRTGLRRYHSALRAKLAVEGLLGSNQKVDAVAEDLGYRSKKNMYRILRTLCGLTPKQIRQLGPKDVDKLVKRLGGHA